MSTLKTISVIHPSGATTNITNDASGNVGIGSSSAPSFLAGYAGLQINSATGTELRLTNSTVGTTNTDGFALYCSTAGDGFVWNNENANLRFATNNTERMRIDSSGNVGIGTSSPTAGGKFDVNGIAYFGTADKLKLYSNNLLQTAGTLDIGTIGSAALIFDTANTERARIDASGNLLVGTTSLVGNERIGVTGTGTYVGVFQQSTNTSGYHVLRCGLQANGGNTSTYFLWGNTNTVGNWYLYGNGTTSFTSDSRLKKNIETTRSGYLDDIAKLRVVKYNWRNDEEGKPRELGLIAQEVEQVFPGLVQDDIEKISPDDDTVYKTVKQSVLPFILLKAIQELKAQNDELKARVATLEAK